MAAVKGLEDYVREKIEKEGMTHSQLSLRLRELYLGVRRLSIRSLERFCASKSIRKTSQASTQQLDEAVCGAIAQVINYLYCFSTTIVTTTVVVTPILVFTGCDFALVQNTGQKVLFAFQNRSLVSYPDYSLHTEGKNSLVNCLFSFCSMWLEDWYMPGAG